MLSPLDDLPFHQVAEPIRSVGTTDRNFYDRYYFSLHNCSDELFLTAGLGQYPNRGVTDAFVAVTRGSTQYVVRASRELGEDRRDTTVGPLSVEVLEGLRRVRLRCEPGHGEIDLDLTWNAAMPALLEPRHVHRQAGRVTTETCRFAQTGDWSGSLRVAGESFDVSPTTWWGARDRSWGIRPIGEPEHPGIRATESTPGFFWIYSQMRFPEFSVVVIIQEDRWGRRSMEEAVRVWPEETGREPEKLGVPRHDLAFEPGTRDVSSGRLSFSEPGGSELVVTFEPLRSVYLGAGTGYGVEPGWRHGMYQGPLVVQDRTYDLGDPDTRRWMRGIVDSVARFELGDEVGYGLFECASLGPYERYDFD